MNTKQYIKFLNLLNFNICSYVGSMGFAIGVWTIIIFNIERVSVISVPLSMQQNIKRLCRNCIWVIVLLAIVWGSPSIWFMKVIESLGCHLQFGWQSSYRTLNTIYWGAIIGYLFGPVILIPILSVLLSLQVRNIMAKSRELKGKSLSKTQVHDVNLHMGQIFIAIYTCICLLPNSSYLLGSVGVFCK